MATIRAGTLMVLTTGSNDDYRISGAYCAVSTFDTDQVVAELLAQHTGEDGEFVLMGDEYLMADKLIPYLLQQRLVFKIELTEWNYGENGKLGGSMIIGGVRRI